jgi:hypothetical protein
VNPVWDMETLQLVGHDGQYEIDHIPFLFDRGAVGTAKKLGQQAGETGATAGSEAAVDRSSVIPGLVRDVNNPTGFTPEQQNNMLVKQQEAAGGGNAAVTGEGRLAALRTRTAGGFAPALAEAARSKGRTLATGALDVANRNAELEQQKQAQARQQLLGLYGVDTSNMLKSMGLQSQDLQDQLAAGRQGWLQNTEGVLNTIGGLGSSAAGVKKAFA